MDASHQILLYEPRLLLRNALLELLAKTRFQVISCLSQEQLTEEICIQTPQTKILLIGAGGMGDATGHVLRTLHHTRSLALYPVVYLSDEDLILKRMFMAVGAGCCLQEEELDTALLPLLDGPLTRKVEQEKLSLSELNVLLDYAAGLQTQEIASRRGCCYKTVFTFKRNARIRLHIESKPGWLNLMSRIAHLAAAYR